MNGNTKATPAEMYTELPLFSTQGYVAACGNCWLNIHRDDTQSPWVHDRTGCTACHA